VGANPPATRQVTVELPPDLGEIDLHHVLKIALEHERESESNYRFLAERVPDTDLGQLFLELAEMEWQHKVDIQNEYNATLDPEQFLIDI
jgi:Rubrerythrin.